MERPPVSALLSWVWIALCIEVDNSFEVACSERMGRLFGISLPMWANGLRLVDDEGITVADLRAAAGAACNLGGLERWGWIVVGEPDGSRRDGYGSARGIEGSTVLRPTPAGSRARKLWPSVVAEVEQRWRDRFGGDVIDAIPDPEAGMPWAPPEVHAPDGFRTHVIEGQRADKDNPLVVRLGQGLTHLTIRHEQNTRVSLPLAANVLRVVGDAVVPVRDLPKLTGLSKEAIAMAVGFLLRRNLVAAAPDRTVRLTDRGIDAHDEYRKARSEDDELRSALEGVLAQREALVSGLVPPEGCWRGQRPHLDRTKRVLADPTGSLPWHPMVLHRGGWPDGS